MMPILIFLVVAIAGSLVAMQPMPDEAPPFAPDGENSTLISSAHYRLNESVLASGGGTFSSPHFRMSATAGQPAVGRSSSANIRACSGFWCKLTGLMKLYLPAIVR